MYKCIHACCCGHFVISPHHVFEDKQCELCGFEMIDRCPECGTIVKEWDTSEIIQFSGADDMLPAYCPTCGKPYPWTEEAIKMAIDALEEETELSEAEQERLIAVMPDILTETSNTPAAIALFKDAILSSEKRTAFTLRGIVRECGCRTAKRQLGL